ncbi:hypothetical protein [Candidatus Chloroploca asiatica]|uniref:hypothetical protein n=1 Tax=Candidatus Chloroploca asiatica TaxID=1506545 RepID=UPI001144D225|nr:hypothetical protein [Candidatus Chloroploca asiatica]
MITPDSGAINTGWHAQPGNGIFRWRGPLCSRIAPIRPHRRRQRLGNNGQSRPAPAGSQASQAALTTHEPRRSRPRQAAAIASAATR